MDAIETILKGIGDIKGILQGIYEPTPGRGLRDRPHRPIHIHKPNVRVPTDPTGLGITQRSAWVSPVLDTHGYTTQNAFVSVTVSGTTAPAQANFVFMEGVLEGAFNSAYVELARQPVIFFGNGDYPIPLLSNLESFATGIRFRLDMMTTEEEPRFLDLDIDGMLVAGPLV